MKLKLRDKIILLLVASVLCFWCEYKLLLTPMRDKLSELNAQKVEAKELLTDITPLQEKAEKVRKNKNALYNKIENIKSTYSEKTIKREDFLVFIGNSSSKNNVYVTRYNNLGITEENGIYKMCVDMELKGSPKNINSVLSDIDSLGVKYSVGSISYRQNDEYDYLKRFYDDITELPWFKEPEKKEDQGDTEQEDITEEGIYQLPENPQPLPMPDTVLPEEKEQGTVLAPDDEAPKTLEERIDSLLQPTVYRNTKVSSGIQLLSKDNNTNINSQDMRLAITICLVMFDEPNSNSVLAYNSESDYGVL